MKIAYAFRRNAFYPYSGERSRGVPHGAARAGWLRTVKEIGFEGLELGLADIGGMDATESQVRELQKELKDAGLPCVAVRSGGGLWRPDVAAQNRRTLEKAVRVVGWMGAEIVAATLTTRPTNRKLGSIATGMPVQPGSSQLATEEDFVGSAEALREVGQMAGEVGVYIAVEVHQHSIADNSWSTLHLLELTDSPYVFANPDLGNIYQNYDVPEETTEEAIVALAPHSRYWHCKNLHRVYMPESERSYFIRVPLPDGDLDYRFAIAAMVEVGYDGYLAIEGATSGDQLHKDRRSVEYVKSILAELDA